jgi:hypothetical protein
MRAAHALHNETACDYLFAGDGFSDWVVTTAFYSALHFAHHELFPGVYDGNSHASLDAYCFSLSKKKHAKRNRPVSKHAITLQLVRRHLNFYPQYHWLYSQCMTARYTNYKLPRSKAIRARQLLASIKTSLSKPV